MLSIKPIALKVGDIFTYQKSKKLTNTVVLLDGDFIVYRFGSKQSPYYGSLRKDDKHIVHLHSIAFANDGR